MEVLGHPRPHKQVYQAGCLFSYHLQHFFYSYRESIPRYAHDLLWNGICELVGVEVLIPFCFSQRSSSAGQAPLAATRKHGALATAIQMRMYEKRSNRAYSAEEVRRIFWSWVNTDRATAMTATLVQDEYGSFLAPLLKSKAAQGGRTSGPTTVQKMLAHNRLYPPIHTPHPCEWLLGWHERIRQGVPTALDLRVHEGALKGQRTSKNTHATKSRRRAKQLLDSTPQFLQTGSSQPGTEKQNRSDRFLELADFANDTDIRPIGPALHSFMRRREKALGWDSKAITHSLR